jgi:hypothetical protein
MLGSSSVAAQLAASQEVLSSTKFRIYQNVASNFQATKVAVQRAELLLRIQNILSSALGSDPRCTDDDFGSSSRQVPS